MTDQQTPAVVDVRTRRADVDDAARRHLAAARAAVHGRSAEVLVHDGVLRQAVIALTAGTVLAEHNAPPAASLHVLTGAVRVVADTATDVAEGHLVALTHQRHSVEALQDSVLLLTTVTGVPAEVAR